MKLYKVGDQSRAICPFCKETRSTTFREENVPLRSGKGTVRDVLVAVCDECHRVVGIPQQSAPRVAEIIQGARRSVEARIPRQLSDVMLLVCSELRAPATEATLFRYYLRRFSSQARLRGRLVALARKPDASGRASARFSAKLSDEAYDRFRSLVHATGLKPGGVVKGVIVQMKEDILDAKDARVRRELEGVLQAAVG